MATPGRGAAGAGASPAGSSGGDRRRGKSSARTRPSLDTLSARHLADLGESGIDEAAARAHGFKTITTRDELVESGFSEAHAKKLVKHLPALAIPSWGPDGRIAGWQVKPDKPPLGGGRGRRRPIRYVTPDGAANVLDFGPNVDAEALADPRCPMFVVEGVKKAVKLRLELARAGKRAIVIALLGVWGWKHTSDRGGRAAHPWLVGGPLAWNDGRLVLVAFDSDVWSSAADAVASRGVPAPAARKAAEQLAKLLGAFGAAVKFIVLPPLENGKQGVDDYLTSGGTIEGLNSYVADEPPSDESNESDGEWAGSAHHPYREKGGGTYYLKRTESGHVPVLLANFTARIERETVLDDGAERSSHYETALRCNGREIRDRVVASRFSGLGWIACAEAIITPGQACRDHLRAAVQHLSAPVESVVAYAHTGWRDLEGIGWTYLHAGGAIGPNGPVMGVQTRLTDLPHYRLPDPPTGEDLRRAVRASLRLLGVAPHRVTAPLLGAIYRAAIGGATTAVFVEGRTGRRKTALVALAQQHYGSAMDAEHLPGNWTSTENTLEAQSFIAKDAVLVIDDFCPAGSSVDHARHHARAARIFRATGNQSARGRMRADLSLAPPKPPRCLVVATGEDVPRGQSIRARMFLVEIEENDVNLDKLTACQADAAAGTYAAALAGYVAWLSPRFVEVRQSQVEIYRTLRAAARATGGHARVPANLAELASGVGWFLEFAVSVGAIEIDEAERLFGDCWEALSRGARDAARYLEGSDPATRYLELLAAAITSGEAHLVDERTGGAPPDPAGHGWRKDEIEGAAWRVSPSSRLVGWRTREEIWLDPDSAFGAVTALAARQGEPFAVGENAVRKRLHEAGWLLRVEIDADGSTRFATRETPRALGRRMRVLVLGPLSSWTPGPTGPTKENEPPPLKVSWPGFRPNAENQTRATSGETGPGANDAPGPEPGHDRAGPSGPRDRAAEPGIDEQNQGPTPRGPIGPASSTGESLHGRARCFRCRSTLDAGIEIGECTPCREARGEARVAP